MILEISEFLQKIDLFTIPLDARFVSVWDSIPEDPRSEICRSANPFDTSAPIDFGQMKFVAKYGHMNINARCNSQVPAPCLLMLLESIACAKASMTFLSTYY